MKLYTYFRSSAAYRVRIALNLKGLTGEMISIHLQKEGGLHKKPAYRAVNPQMRVPALQLDSGDVIDAWYHHWILAGFDAVEAMIRPGRFAFGNEVTLADICLVPQVYNARRLKVPLDRFPKIVAADAALGKLPAFDQARPENQPDAE